MKNTWEWLIKTNMEPVPGMVETYKPKEGLAITIISDAGEFQPSNPRSPGILLDISHPDILIVYQAKGSSRLIHHIPWDKIADIIFVWSQ